VWIGSAGIALELWVDVPLNEWKFQAAEGPTKEGSQLQRILQQIAVDRAEI